MKSNLKVSILVPIYGVEQYIEECAKSLFKQDYSNIEFIFVNDCTKDNSIKKLQNTLELYPNRKSQTKIINHITNKGLSAARNTALENATGEFLLPIDSDDFLNSPSTVSELINKINEEKADAVFYDMQFYPSKTCIHQNICFNPKTLTKNILERKTSLGLCGGIYKKDIFIKNNIRSIETISMGEDYAIKPLLTYNMRKIAFISKPYYCYRKENENSITKKFKSSYIKDLNLCINGFNTYFSQKPDYEDYLESINIGAIRCKLVCIALWANLGGDKSDFSNILNLFKSIKISYKYLSPSEIILYILLQLKAKKFIKLYVKSGVYIKNIINKVIHTNHK